MPLRDSWIDALRPRRRPVFSQSARRLKNGSYLGAIALLAMGYFFLVKLIYSFHLDGGLATYPIWPPAAYSQLVLLLVGLRFWPAITLGSLLTTAFSGEQTTTASLISALNNTLQALLGSWLLLRGNFSPRLDHLRDVGLLIVFAAALPSALSATIGILNCCCCQNVTLSKLGAMWLTWWISNVGGTFILFPAVLAIATRSWQFYAIGRGLLFGTWTVGLSLLSWFVFVGSSQIETPIFPLEYLTFPAVAWGALRFGLPGAGVAIVIATGFAGLGVINGAGPFVPPSEMLGEAAIALQAYICILVITALTISATTAEREKAQRELHAEKEKSEELLLNILPQPIATRLKRQEGTIADHFAEATVLFADIVNFTYLSTELSPQALVILLNEIFSTFDTLADKHGLEKIKTIGDAYMVVGGLPEHRHDHAIAMADMAIDMQRAISDFSQKHDRPFSMRIGINTGPVVAGVIGHKKFIYDLWGDTVNIASRMESTGAAGEIQVTQTTYEALKAHYAFDCRGEVAVKGKGMMTTYWMRDRWPVPIG